MKILLLLLAHLWLITALAQQTKENSEYYLTKSKRQNTVGGILMGTGVILLFAAAGSNNSGDSDPGFGLPENFGKTVLLGAGGLVATIAGIPFLISGKKNARKAASIAVNSQKILSPQANGAGLKLQPAIVLKIDLDGHPTTVSHKRLQTIY